MVFLCGGGGFFELFKKAGAKNIFYAPNCYDPKRFGSDWTPTFERRFDVVMIANPVRGRIPFIDTFPGAKNRIKTVRLLGDAFGDRFAIYGNGWDGFIGARGPLPFDQQEKIIRDSWLSVCWDHFEKTPLYFSNRLPISLASSVGHVTNYKPGFELFFQNGKHLVWAGTPEEMVDNIRCTLSQGTEHLISLGANGRKLAQIKLTVDSVYGEIFAQILRFMNSENNRAQDLGSR
jgi:hypothetical protein